jgi:hypothetical protein
MGHVKDKDELWALALLEQIIQRDRKDRDALPGSVIKHVKAAAKIIKKRQEAKRSPERKREKEAETAAS